MTILVKMVTVTATGRRYLWLNEHRDIVECKGEVQRLSGFSPVHGPNRKFKRTFVELAEVELTEDLLKSLLTQGGELSAKPTEKPKKWVEFNAHSHVLDVTDYARRQLQRLGEKMPPSIHDPMAARSWARDLVSTHPNFQDADDDIKKTAEHFVLKGANDVRKTSAR
jgi:hypothetical protein